MNSPQIQKVPTWITYSIVVICLLPFCLHLFGGDFGTQDQEFSFEDAALLPDHKRVDKMFTRLSGAFSHTILEWSSFMTAFLTALLALAHFKIKPNSATPVIGMALFCSGCMDAFHTLAADRLIEAVADNRSLIPFTWAISRTFNALIMMVGVGIFLFKKERAGISSFPFVIGVSICFGLTAYAIIHYCATSGQLPQTMFPDSVITRPWDVAPLILFLINGRIFWIFYNQNRNLFSHALVISVIPEVAVETHMAFGSTALFDSHFNIAHFLKIFAYLVPFLGLCLDYVRSHQLQLQVEKSLRKSEAKVRTIVENADTGIVTIGEQGCIESFNPAAERIFGYSLDTIIGKNITQLMPLSLRQSHEEGLKSYLATGKAKTIGQGKMEVVGLRSDGMEFPMEVAINEFSIGDQKLFVGILSDVTSRKDVEKELMQAKQEAESSNLAKSTFLTNMSHEIRTPLNAILGYAQILDRDDSLTREHHKFLSSINSSGNHLLELINEILDISKIESGKMEINLASLDLQKLISGLNSIFHMRCSQKKLDWRIHGMPEKPIFVQGDITKLRGVLINLLGNAVKFTESGGIIFSIIADGNDNYTFAVSDTGTGIPVNAQSRIFQAFQQESDGARKGGTGLGLSIAYRQVELMGGRLKVESTPGKGSKFYFTLELPVDHKLVETGQSLISYRDVSRLADGYEVTVLVVDDDRHNREVLCTFLKGIGSFVEIAINGKEAVEVIRNHKPDIVFMDERMPVMCGTEAVIQIRKSLYSVEELPIICVSASALQHQKEKFVDAGCNFSINKPVIMEEILRTLVNCLNVKFEHNRKTLTEVIPFTSQPLSDLELPCEILGRLKIAAQTYNITDLKALLVELDELGSDGQVLSRALQEPLDNFQMDIIEQQLGEIVSEAKF